MQEPGVSRLASVEGEEATPLTGASRGARGRWLFDRGLSFRQNPTRRKDLISESTPLPPRRYPGTDRAGPGNTYPGRTIS